MQESKNFCINYQFSFELNGNWCTVEAVWCAEFHTYCSHVILKGENSTSVISLTNVSICLCSDFYRPISFKLGMVVEATKLCFLISV